MGTGSSRRSWKIANLNSSFQTVILVCFVAVLSYLAARLGGTLILSPQGAWPLWLGNILLVSILLLVPRRMWPILIAAAFTVFILNDLQTGRPISSIAWLILADTIEVLTAALCLSYFFEGVPRLNSVRALAKFSLFAVILAPCMGAFFVALANNGNYWTNWRISFFSEAIVSLTLMPAILGWVSKEPARGSKSSTHYVEAAVLIAGLVLLFGYLTFGAPGRGLSEVLIYLLVPIMLWSALRFGSTGVSTAVIVIAVLAIWGATHSRGPFVEPGPLHSVLSLQLFLLFAAAPFMVLAAVVEQDKQASEQFFRSIFENAQIGINFFSLDGRETFSNRACQEMLGCTEQELSHVGNWDEMVHPDDRVSGATRYRELQQGKRERDEWEQRYIRRDGRVVVTSARFTLLRNARGKPQCIVGLMEDITERKRAREALQESEQLFRSVFENAQIGISVFNIDRQTIAPNHALQEMLGYTQTELARLEKWDGIYHPDERAAAAELYSEVVHGKRDQSQWEQRLMRKDGRIATVSVRFSLLRNGAGRPQYVAALQEDITERKRLQAELVTAKEVAEAATKAKSDFLANMSHEIRTPMNAILGMTHLALKTELTLRQRDYLTKTKVAAQALLAIINDILDVSKIEAGKLEMEKTDFRLDSVLENLSSVVSQKAHDKNLEFLIAVRPDLPPNLVGDALRLGQILINLVNNAVKFTERGEVAVIVTLEERLSDRVKLRFSVQDSGIGMTPEQTDRLFQAFSQADTSTTRKYGGTGLGLSISKRLVEMMGGEIWVESSHNAGSTFFFTAWFGIGSCEHDQKHFVPDLSGIRALIVDNNRLALEILGENLKAFAMRVGSVSSGEEALRELSAADMHDPYQAVLIDWHMPGLDGLETSRIIKHGGLLKHVPKVVMVTGFGREDVRAQAEQIGIEGFLLKPVSPSLLCDVLMDLFGVAGIEHQRFRERKDNRAVPDATGIRVLLVEDNVTNQQVASELLVSAGAIVTVANHGGEAVKMLTDGNQAPAFDVVFMDLQMPEMDGFTATRLLREDPRLHRLPIIAMTAHALVHERQRCLDAGMSDHVSKPIDPDHLLSTLIRWAKPRSQPVLDSGASSSPIRASDEVVLPEIAGITLADGLKRVAGNKRLYRDLLGQFAANQGKAADEISSALESDDHALAERIAHTVKGVAGNLGITEVQFVAQKLETALSDGEINVSPLLVEFASVMGTQVRAIENALCGSPIEPVRTSPFNEEAAAAAIARLRTLLEASDGDAEESFRSLYDAVASAVEKPHLDSLSESINNFNFDRALVKLDEIADCCRQIGGNHEPG
jgi:PAS domain S-box-containing protein